jgi:hypothetical protein
VTLTWPDGQSRTVAFDPTVEADIAIDVGAVRAHMEATEPE